MCIYGDEDVHRLIKRGGQRATCARVTHAQKRMIEDVHYP